MNALGLIFSNIHDNNVPELTMNRTVAAIPFGGRYRLIDFPLSAMVNSGITHVGVITKRNYRSLMDHVGSGKDWDLARRNGGFVLLPPFGEKESTSLYGTRLEALKTVLGFIMRCEEKYILLSDSNAVYSVDYTPMFRQHELSGADITMLYCKKQSADISGTNNVVLKLDREGNVKEILTDPRMQGTVNLYGNIILMKKDLLVSIVSDAVAHGQRHFIKDMIVNQLGELKIMGYRHDGYFEEISSLTRFYKVNLGLLDRKVMQKLFGGAEIYTKVKDSAPTVYGENAIVKNSLISDGCVIEGEVYNSVLYRGVKVGRGTVIRDSVIMKNTFTGENVTLNCVVTDKNVVVRDKRVLSGADTHPFYISKDTII